MMGCGEAGVNKVGIGGGFFFFRPHDAVQLQGKKLVRK